MFSFNLTEEFVKAYVNKPVKWGHIDAGGNPIGEIIFLDKYSQLKEDGTKEKWWECCARIVNGMYSIQKDWARNHMLPWSDRKAQASAQEAFDRLFNMKWTPPGRGMDKMGTPLVMGGNSMPLQNCAYISTGSMTKNDPSEPFCFLMHASALGVGVGFDTLGADKGFRVFEPVGEARVLVVEDSREGWVESLRLLLNSYLKHGQAPLEIDTSQVRAKGMPIRTFGGTASGPEALEDMHAEIHRLFKCRGGSMLTSVDILDIANLIGRAIVAGGARRSALLALGNPGDDGFSHAKDPAWYPERNKAGGWAWSSNNSISVKVGDDYSPYIEGIVLNGEPGFVWLDVARNHGRMTDAPNSDDHRITGVNPCGEQFLESGECCTLVETYPTNHETLEDFQRTLKFAYLYAKTVTLLPTIFPETNAIMQRNRRIGISFNGAADFSDERGRQTARNWMSAGYDTVKYYDHTYSEWLCVRESIRMTTEKPSGTSALMVGVSPGGHWSIGGAYFMRAVIFQNHNPMIECFKEAGYKTEPREHAPDHETIVYFPVKSHSKRADDEVSAWEKSSMALDIQRYWSDNAVSVTVSFDPKTEADQILPIVQSVQGQLKTISFLPRDDTAYNQAPFTKISEQEYNEWVGKLKPVDTTAMYSGPATQEPTGEKFCTTDVCEIPLAA